VGISATVPCFPEDVFAASIYNSPEEKNHARRKLM